MNINNILHKIQQELKAPKNQYNSFGKYKYRSCEDIVEAVKKLLPEGVHLTLADSVECHGDRVFVRSLAKISSTETNTGDLKKFITASGFAEIAKEQKGMQAAQITGSASSYARKYALNGLFCIDDTKDDDAGVDHAVTKPPPTPKKELTDAEKRDWMSKKTAEMVTNLQTMEDLNGLNAFTQKMDKTLEALKLYPDLNESWGVSYAKRLGELK